MIPSINSLLRFVLGLVILAAMVAPAAQGQAISEAKTGGTTAGAPDQARIDEIIRRFAAKESQFRHALNTYAFKRDALIQILGMGGQVVGEYHRVSEFTFDDQGNRYEKINFFPLSNIGEVITAEDLEGLGGVNPFALEATKLGLYNFKYVGKERIDDLDLYVFDVAPKVTPGPKKTKDRFFAGRIWVDDQDLQIVKSKCKAIRETKTKKFPVVETYREQINGKYWFPTYAYADDDLIFDNGTDMRTRMQVKYTNYIIGRGKVTITELDEAKPESNPGETSSGPKPRVTAPIEAGELNSQAIDLPDAMYPGEARKTHAAGEVKVRVIVDETGHVLAADVISGPKPLWLAAIDAARKARFKPTLVGGTAVKITGILTYNFVEK